MEQESTLIFLKSELKQSREKYKKLVEETIREHLHKKFIHAQIHMYKVNDGLKHGKEYRAKYYGQNLKIKNCIMVIDPLTQYSIDKLNLSSMESIEPKMSVMIETNKGLVKKDITYYAVKEYINPETINPNEYEF